MRCVDHPCMRHQEDLEIYIFIIFGFGNISGISVSHFKKQSTLFGLTNEAKIGPECARKVLKYSVGNQWGGHDQSCPMKMVVRVTQPD